MTKIVHEQMTFAGRSNISVVKKGQHTDASQISYYGTASSANPLFIHRKSACACGGGCPACQAKSGDLRVSQPNDAAEIEADQIADGAMRMAEPGRINTKADTGTIHTRENTEPLSIHSKSSSDSGGALVSSDRNNRLNASRGGGNEAV